MAPPEPAPRKPYDPSIAHRFVHKVPLWSNIRGARGYPLDILGGRYQQVVALTDIDNPLSDRAHGQGMNYENKRAIGYGDVKLHDMVIMPKRSFADEGQTTLIKASKILADAAKDGIKTAVTCDLGQRRTGRALYLMHRRLGASHEEALELSNPNKDEADHLKRIYETMIEGKEGV